MKTILKVKEYIIGKMEEYIKVNGSTTKCKVEEFSTGQMVVNMKEIMWMIRKKDMVSFTGQMEENMMDSG